MGLMRHAAFATADLSSLRVCSSGSAALPEDVLRRWEAVTGCPVCEGYGQTEAGPVLTYNPLVGLRKPGTVGHAVPQTEVQIVDPETGTRLLPPGEPGEIRARGPQIMAGYRNRPAETAEALRDGWLYTGDIGTLDADGYLTIRDRKKDMVVTAGYNVYPREIEEALFALPGVADAAVVGVPDDYRGEALAALVVRADPALTGEAVMAHLGDRLTRYKWPREVRFLDALPKTAVAKTDKAALRRLLNVAPNGDKAAAAPGRGDTSIQAGRPE
jgi:long-chain acyl-CoA synthetase